MARYFYIAMEYLEGRNLSEVIGDGPLAPERAAGLAIQLCQFLEAAHGFEATIDGRHLRSLLHGDLKPRNIRVLDGDRIKVLDFGIAKALSLSRKVTRNDFGSIAYLSPERLESGEIDAARGFLGGRRPALRNGGRRPAVSGAGHAPPGAAHPIPAPGGAARAAVSARPAGDRRQAARRGCRRIATATPRPFATISNVSSAGATTQAEREGWPARAHDEPATRRTTSCRPGRRGSDASDAPSDGGPATHRAFDTGDDRSAGPAASLRNRGADSCAGLPRTALLLLALVIVGNEMSVASRGEARQGRRCRWWNSTASAGSGISTMRSTPAEPENRRHRTRARVDESDGDAGRSRDRQLPDAAPDGQGNAVEDWRARRWRAR